jgi:predicted TIM-barrel fold metal-dependent hydrolase
LGAIGTVALAGAADGAQATQRPGNPGEPKGNVALDLKDFQPRSALHVPETRVPRSRFPVVDVHAHLSWAVSGRSGASREEKMRYPAPPEEILQVMERKNIRTMVNLTGGFGAGLKEAIQKFQTAHPGRFLTFVEPRWHDCNKAGYDRAQADDVVQAQRDGARGLKVLKTLGLYVRETTGRGSLVKVDDRRFDLMWEACAAMNMPVAIHVSDPEAFFLPIDRFNERYEELNNHPDWSFYGRDFPSNSELLEARNRVFARHPKTQFVALHVGNNAENLPYVSECLNKFPNMHVDLGARIGELGRQPRTARRFFEKHQDRILFGTDAVPHGNETPQQVFGDLLYEIYYRFLETEDEYFDYAPAPVPPQGRWRIYGLGLPEQILKKVYYDNAARVLGLPAI